MDNSKHETWTDRPMYSEPTVTGESDLRMERFKNSIESLDNTYQGVDEPDTNKRRDVLEKEIPNLVSSINLLGGVQKLSEEELKTFLESISHAVSGEAEFNEIPVKQRYQIFKPVLELINENADFIMEGNLYYYNPYNFTENYDSELTNYINDPEGYKEPKLQRDASMVDWDIAKLSGLNTQAFVLPAPMLEMTIQGRYGKEVISGNERVDNPEFALLDLVWQIKIEDGKSKDALDKLEALIKQKGERLGFLAAITFLNSFHESKITDEGKLTGYKANEVSQELQTYLIDKIETYLDSINSVNDENETMVTRDLRNIRDTVNRSIMWIYSGENNNEKLLSAEEIKKWQEKGTPASGDTYLNLDNLYRLLSVVDKFSHKDFVKDRTVLDAEVAQTVAIKKSLEDKGLSVN